MKKIICLFTLFALSLLIFAGCNIKTSEHRLGLLKNEILQVEKNFAEQVKVEGIDKAFLNFAAEDAVLYRNNTLIKGKKAIKEFFESQTLKDINMEWKTDFVDVSITGDLAYTYGNFKLSAKDNEGLDIINEGSFHTVWKRQKDGSWKFVWD